MTAPSWPLWRGGEIQFWTDSRGWAVDHIGRHADSCALISSGLPTLVEAEALAARYLKLQGLHRIKVVTGGER